MIIITIMSLFIFAKMYSLCHNNQYNNYENQQQKKPQQKAGSAKLRFTLVTSTSTWSIS